jgi:hypothetical protein
VAPSRKPSSHQTIAEYLRGAELEEHRQTTVSRGKRTTTIYRWFSGVPLRATDDALSVNWFSEPMLRPTWLTRSAYSGR